MNFGGIKNLMDLQYSPVVSQSVPRRIMKQIRRKIVIGELAPGEKLPPERELVDLIGCSRPSLREALRVLCDTCIISSAPGIGFIVQEIPNSVLSESFLDIVYQRKVDMMEFYQFRVSTESEYARWAALNREQADIDNMRRAIEALKDANNRGDWAKFQQAHSEYHSNMVAATKNHFAAIFNDMIFPLASQIIGYFIKNLDAENKAKQIAYMLESHTAMLEAIERGQPDVAKELCVDHLKLFRELAGSGEIPMIFPN